MKMMLKTLLVAFVFIFPAAAYAQSGMGMMMQGGMVGGQPGAGQDVDYTKHHPAQ
ncbi:MAG: hypothetical protein KGI29_06850 [Pseudomonadota bacterium]|nr:hypothetical protein [Pseudomonadota bacterium]MDE3037522.1 hypothetical protein [Pseudomonadota bacterium]